MKRCIALIVGIMLMLTSCGVSSETPPPKTEDDDNTLRVALWLGYPYISRAIEIFESQHEGIKVIVEGSSDGYDGRIRTAMQNGTAPDIIQLTANIDYEFGGSSSMVDLYTLMEKDPDFDKSDYFENIFESLEIDGRLTGMPGGFGISFVGVNAMFPNIVEEFAGYETISDQDMLRMYQSIADKKGLPMSHSYDIVNVIFAEEFINFQNRTCLYNTDEFVAALAAARQVLPEKYSAGTNFILEYGTSAVFTEVDYTARRVLMPMKEPYTGFREVTLSEKLSASGDISYAVPTAVVDFKPRVDSNGNAFFTAVTSPPLGITASSNKQELAWEFIKLLTGEGLEEIFMGDNPYPSDNINDIFIHKGFNHAYTTQFYQNYCKSELGVAQLPQEIEDDIEMTVQKIEGYASLPVVNFRLRPQELVTKLYGIANDFVNGKITATEAAALMDSTADAAFEK